MFPTAEIRWFYPGRLPSDVLAWFQQGHARRVEPAGRTDRYLGAVDTDGLGVKLREGRVEVKQRFRSPDLVTLAEGVAGYLEHWRKWSFALAPESGEETASWIAVSKERWLRRYSLLKDGGLEVVPPSRYPDRACDLEVTQVRAGGQVWWTLGFEAFGQTSALRDILLGAAEEILRTPPPMPLTAETSYSYPRWLALAV